MRLAYLITGILLSSVMLFSACQQASPSSPAIKPGNSTITEGVMTTAVDDNSKPTGGIVTSFPVSTPVIYCSFKVNDVAKDDMIKATWIYVGGEAADRANTQINETYDIVQSPEPSYHLAFYLDKPAEGWARGDYKVVLSINNKEKLTVPFKME